MKKLLTLILLSAISFTSQAVPMTWTDTLDFDDVYFGSGYKGGVNSYSYTHDLTSVDFNPKEDDIFSAVLNVNLFDDSNSIWDWSEIAYIDQPGSDDKIVEVSYKDVDLGISFEGLYALNASGMLDVTINRLWGDFILSGSTLTAEGVPEPAPFILFALAIVGFSIAQRKRNIG